MRLIALHEALQETLRREDYEQAAEIRDQINQLKNQNTTDAP
ncbi:ClpC ATPase [Chlamydia trachomatis]|nr:ClpC ATPase [Chlamydia trachomatis]